MRNRLSIGTAALLLASATVAWAQDTPQNQASGSSSGSIDVGGRGTSASGDEARYERYRDLRSGANVNLLFNKETDNWTFNVKAQNIGYRDGRYVATFNSRRVKFTVLFDETPLNYSYDSRSPYNCTAGSCTLDSTLRSEVQAKTAIGVPQSVAQLGPGSIYDSIANPVNLQSRRDTFTANARISATDNLDFLFGVNTYKRSGNMPEGAGFAFNVATELPVVIDNRETELSVGVEWASHQGMFHVGYQHSKFDQNIPSFTFDNPYRATDYSGTPGTGYDPEGFVDGNGPAYGRMSQPPSNSVDTVNWLGMVKLPGHTTANASFAMAANRQDEALIPWTTNSVIESATTLAAYPGLAALPRDTADMSVNYANGTMNVSSRPNQYLSVTARYRFNSRTDLTPPFDGSTNVALDAVPETGGAVTEALNISQNTFDVDASLTPVPYSAIRVGYGFAKWQQTSLSSDGWKDNTARVSFDTVGNQYITLRAKFEHVERRSEGLDVNDILASGDQPALRFFDEASRNTNRGTFVVELMPVSTIGINFSLVAGKDDYQGADATQLFGLLNNTNTTYAVGVEATPNAKVNFGADYGRETYNALQESRNANPAPDPTWTDPSRNWNLTNGETDNNFTLYLNLVKALAKTDIRFAYDYSDSNQDFLFGGPRIDSLTAIGQFIPLPNVTNKWQHATIDLRYALSKKIGIGVSYMYEKLDVADFATIDTAGPATLPLAQLGTQTNTPRSDWLGTITTGYGNRPYTGQTAIVRVFYMF